MKLTDLAIKNAKPDPTRRREIADALVRGLFLIVQTSGVRSWALRYRSSGRARKLTIGGFRAIDLAEARKLAKVAIGEIARGKDPGAEKIAARRAAALVDDVGPKTTFAQVRDEFLRLHISKKRPHTRRQAEGLLRREFGKWDRRAIGEITRGDVNRVLDGIVARGHAATANRSHAFVRKLFKWAITRGYIETSPVTGIERPADETSRDRVLSNGELKQIWEACDNLPQQYASYSSIVRLLVLTGARRKEVSEMEWSEVDLDAGRWTLPAARSKNRNAYTLPLSDAAVAILRDVLRLFGSRFVFTLAGDRPVNDFSAVKHAFDALLPADMPHWTFHDLRRTTATGLARLGTPIHVTEAVLNHKSGTIKGIAAIYNRYDYQPEMKAALQQWADHIDQLTR